MDVQCNAVLVENASGFYDKGGECFVGVGKITLKVVLSQSQNICR